MMILKMEPLRFCGASSFLEVEQPRPILAAQKEKIEIKGHQHQTMSSAPGIPNNLQM